MFDANLHTLDNPREDTEEFISAVQLMFESMQKLLVELPWYKIFPNKVYRDWKKAFTVSIDAMTIIYLRI